MAVLAWRNPKIIFGTIVGLLVVALSALYIVVGFPPYLGQFIDDALYVTLSQSILHGHYRAIFSPAFEVLTFPLPGYPLFLAPWVALFGFAPVLFKILSILLSLGSVMLVFIWLRRLSLPPAVLWAAALSLGFNPLFVLNAASVMSEPGFVFFSILPFLFIDSDRPRLKWTGGFLWAWAVLFRPQGIFLIGAIVIYFLLKKEPRVALQLGLTSSLFLLLVLARNGIVSGNPLGYATYIKSSWRQLFDASVYYQRLKTILGLSFPFTVFQIPMPALWWLRKMVAWSCNLVGVAALIRVFTRNDLPNSVRISSLFVLLTLAALPFWIVADLRYVFVLLPFIIIALAIEAHEVLRLHRYAKSCVLIIFIGIGSFYSRALIQEVKQTMPFLGTTDAGLSRETFNWISTHLQEDESLLSPAAPVVYLYGKRKCLTLVGAASVESLIKTMKGYRVGYVFLDESPHNDVMPGSPLLESFDNLHEWVENPKLFEVVYRNREERTQIYKLRS